MWSCHAGRGTTLGGSGGSVLRCGAVGGGRGGGRRACWKAGGRWEGKAVRLATATAAMEGRVRVTAAAAVRGAVGGRGGEGAPVRERREMGGEEVVGGVWM